METLEKIKKIIADVCGVDVSVVNESSSVGDFPSWDSMAHLTILSTIEEELNVDFEPEEMMDFESVSDIVKAVANKQ